MSDFTSDFWGIFVIVFTVAGLVYCAFLLLVTGRMKVKSKKTAGQPADVTGHTWDGDLEEYNNPLPRWWMWLFWITIAFAVIYLILYPGLGRVKGALDWTSTGAYTAERDQAEAALKPLYDKYLAMDVKSVAADPQARAMGERLFLNYCAPCHGSDARGSSGFPNLRHRNFLYGSDPEQIETTITRGRLGIMPALGSAIGEEGVRDVVAYVRSLSGLPHDSLKAQMGKAVFAQYCTACHGPEGKGNTAMGAPNLSDQVWLYGSSEATITEGVMKGRHTNVTEGSFAMPSFELRLGAGRIHLLAAYVWELSNSK